MRALIPLVILLFAFSAVSALAKQPPSVVTCPCIERFVNYWFIGERSPQHWGCSGRRFKSCRPDQLNKKATFSVAFLFNRQDGSFEGRALGSQITPAAELGQGAQRRSPAGVLIAERLLRSNLAIGLYPRWYDGGKPASGTINLGWLLGIFMAATDHSNYRHSVAINNCCACGFLSTTKAQSQSDRRNI